MIWGPISSILLSSLGSKLLTKDKEITPGLETVKGDDEAVKVPETIENVETNRDLIEVENYNTARTNELDEKYGL